MSQIRFNPEGLSNASTKLHQQGADLGTLITQMQTVVSSLTDCWEGAAAVAYGEQFASLKPGLIKAQELVETIATQIDQTLAAAQELDTNIAGKFK